jgi:hypothetical protein
LRKRVAEGNDGGGVSGVVDDVDAAPIVMSFTGGGAGCAVTPSQVAALVGSITHVASVNHNLPFTLYSFLCSLPYLVGSITHTASFQLRSVFN